MTQYRIELWRIMKSVIFLLMAAGIVLFAYTQGVLPPETTIAKPEPNGNYGMKSSNDPALIMPEAAESLFAQYSANKYITYPNGFYKVVKLNHTDRKKMTEIITELSINGGSDVSSASSNNLDAEGYEIKISGDSMKANEDGSFQIITPDNAASAVPGDFQLNPDITWKRFQSLMTQADKLLGGGSDFSEAWISHRFGRIHVTYEEALADYELVLTKDKVSGTYARLFSDYMGIILGLLPIFPTVFLCLSDRKNISPMLYTRRISSVSFILTRYFALVTATMLPILLMGMVLTGIHGAEHGIANIDVFAYLKYTFFWLLPTAMASIAVGLFFTTLTHTPIAIAIQLIWWFIDIGGDNGTYSFFGVRSLQLIPRHNDLGKVEAYVAYLPSLIQNRIWIVLITALLVLVSIYVFSVKRRGLLYVPSFKHSKVQSAI